MITRYQAIHENYFHRDGCKREPDGPRGGAGKVHILQVRRNGQTKTWKTRPNDWRIPVKYGLKRCFYIWNVDANFYHVESECPLLVKTEETSNAVAD